MFEIEINWNNDYEVSALFGSALLESRQAGCLEQRVEDLAVGGGVKTF